MACSRWRSAASALGVAARAARRLCHGGPHAPISPRTARLQAGERAAGAADRRAARPPRHPGRHPDAASPSGTPGSGCSPTSSRSIPRCRPPASAARRSPRAPVLADDGPAMRQSQEIRVDLNALIRRANLLASSFEEAADSLASHSHAAGRHAVHHADAGLAHQRLLLHARASDPAHRAAARGHRRRRRRWAARSRRRPRGS